MPEETSHGGGQRRLEDIALDLMKFVAITTSHGKAPVSAGFQGRPEKTEDYAESLLQLYQRCRTVVEGKA